MREIKFRAWNKEKKKIYRFDDLQYCNEYNLLAFGLNKDDYEKDGGQYCNLSCDIDDLIIMQFTGLKDKQGKEIYEGDIGKLTIQFGDYPPFNEYGVMTFNEEAFYSFKFEAETDYGNGDVKSVEVIGNIYENPELLKEVGR